MKAELIAVIVKEFRQILRDKRMFFMLIFPPIIQLLIFGYAINYDVKDVRTAVCDFDRTAQSREFVRGLLADGTFVAAGVPGDCARPELSVRTGDAEVALVIPPGFAKAQLRGEPVAVQALVDGTNPLVGRFARDTIGAYASFASLPIARERLANAEVLQGTAVTRAAVALEPRLLFNPEMKTSIFMVPGVAGMLLIVITMIATAMGLAREKESGVLEQVIVTPIPVPILIVGKVLPFIIVGLFDVLIVLLVSVALFHVPVRGSLVLYGIGTVLYLLNTVGLGLFISTISATQQQAFLTGFLILAPLVLLSGVMTPISSMPEWLQWFTYGNPMRYYVQILRGVLLKASDLRDLAGSFFGLAAFGVAVLGMASLRFTKRLG